MKSTLKLMFISAGNPLKNVAFVINREMFNDCSNFYSSLIGRLKSFLAF